MSIWKRLINNSFNWLQNDNIDKKPSKNKNIATISPNHDTDFAGAVVALAAKMAKADGIATTEEALAFRAAFPIPKEDNHVFDRLFKMAASSSLGYDGYAKKIGRKYNNNRQILLDVLAVLFFVAVADGTIKESEKQFLQDVSNNLGLTESDYSSVAQYFYKEQDVNPYLLLGIHESDDDATIKKAWLDLVIANHPDTFLGRGEPPEFIKLATQKTAAANYAYKLIREQRKNKV